jgi:hypothetical protein
VVTVNVAVVAPTATVTLADTVAAEVTLLDSDTIPLAGAAAVNVTVPVEVVGAVTFASPPPLLRRCHSMPD